MTVRHLAYGFNQKSFVREMAIFSQLRPSERLQHLKKILADKNFSIPCQALRIDENVLIDNLDNAYGAFLSALPILQSVPNLSQRAVGNYHILLSRANDLAEAAPGLPSLVRGYPLARLLGTSPNILLPEQAGFLPDQDVANWRSILRNPIQDIPEIAFLDARDMINHATQHNWALLLIIDQ